MRPILAVGQAARLNGKSCKKQTFIGISKPGRQQKPAVQHTKKLATFRYTTIVVKNTTKEPRMDNQAQE